MPNKCRKGMCLMQSNIREKIEYMKRNGYCIVPHLIQIEITRRCPLHCPQCYKSLSGDKKDFPFKNLYPILEEAAELGVNHIMLNGGEPVLYPEWDILFDTIKKLGLISFVVLSGYGVNENFVNKYSKYIDKTLNVAISLNGSSEDIHALSRDGYEYALNAMNLFKKEKVPYSINWVARKDNIDDFPKLIELSKELNASSITVALTKLDSSGKLPSKLENHDIKKLADIIDNTNDLMNKKYIQVQYCFPLLNRLLKKYVNKSMNRCPAGYRSLYVDIDGKFAPCSHMPHLSEEVTSIKNYWENSKIINKIRFNEMGNKNCINHCKDSFSCKNCYCMDYNNYKNLSLGLEDCPIIKLINS